MKTREIADYLTGDLVGDGEIEISGIASLENASQGDLAFIEKSDLIKDPASINASCLLVPETIKPEFAKSYIKVENPRLAFARIGEKLHPSKEKTGLHGSAVISSSSDVRASFIGAFATVGQNSSIGEESQIYEGVRIGDNVEIGRRSIIYPNCVIYDNVSIGDDCIIHASTVIGADGFGFVRDDESHVKFPQIGSVVIENNVEIGANSCVDRGALGETRIGEGTKIDNQVQVAHNVRIGRRVVIAAQVGISGSATIEDDCKIGGQVGIGDHATIKKGAVIGGKSGVFPGKIVRKGFWGGIPVQPIRDYKEQNASIRSLPKLKQELNRLKKRLSE